MQQFNPQKFKKSRIKKFYTPKIEKFLEIRNF